MKVRITTWVSENWFDDPSNVTVEEVQELAADDYRDFLDGAEWEIVEDGEH